MGIIQFVKGNDMFQEAALGVDQRGKVLCTVTFHAQGGVQEKRSIERLNDAIILYYMNLDLLKCMHQCLHVG